MEIYNTLTKRKEEFKPLEPGKVKMYVCGPTVYNYIHIGNARPMIVFDTVRRYMEYKGYDVNYVSNFTDVDDKIIKKATEEGVEASVISERFIKECKQDMAADGGPEVQPRQLPADARHGPQRGRRHRLRHRRGRADLPVRLIGGRYGIFIEQAPAHYGYHPPGRSPVSGGHPYDHGGYAPRAGNAGLHRLLLSGVLGRCHLRRLYALSE